MSNIDIAEQKLKSLVQDIQNDLTTIRSEEDAKVKIINRLFNECLGWSFTKFTCENNHDCGFSDYIMKVDGKPSLVVEAKRTGILGVETAVLNKYRTLKISGASLKPSMPGIQQAFSYASEAGIPISVLTDGITWIIFKTWVQGSSYKEKEAFVFPSLEAIENSFGTFYELLAYEHFIDKTYNVLFDQIHNSRQNLSVPLSAPLEVNEINILPKHPIAFDLEKIFNSFFTQLTGDNNSEIMRECFVESNESHIADYSLEKITNSILNTMPDDKNKVGPQLSDLIEGNIQTELPSDSDMTVFIVGPTGSGKTTYIDRFFSKILPKTAREKCLIININCLDATGVNSTSTAWITEQMISALESYLFKEGYPEYNELQGMYFNNYRRMSSGALKKIYDNDRPQFEQRFAEFLDGEVQNNREAYLEKLLHFSIHNRKKLPIVIVDNTDEFTLDFKIQIFQICNSYRRKVNYCMLIFPVTDKSAWSFSKTDIFTIHQSRSFFLPTPSPREVFRKRIEFLNRKLISSDKCASKEYLSSKGIRIELKDVTKFAQVLEDIFVNNDFTAKTLGELTNYNIRSIMNLSKRIITSPVIGIETLITSYVSSEPINYTKFIDALIRGDYEAYRLSTSEDFGVISTFKVNSSKIHSPLLILRILSLLQATKLSSRDVEESHLTIPSITQYFEAIGADTVDIERCLAELISLKLVEPYDPSAGILNDSQKLAITYKGLAHYQLSTRNSVYFYQMAITTGITNPEVVSDIKNYYKSKHSFSETTSYIRKKFLNYLIDEDSKFISSSSSNGKEQYECQNALIRDLQVFGANKNARSGAVPDKITNFIGDKLIGKVNRYDPEKDYGFISLKMLDQDVYFKLANLEKNALESIHDSDILFCTIDLVEGKIIVKTIDGFVEGKNELQITNCTIKMYNSERGFGFVYIGSSSNEAFFHKTAFPENFYDRIREGLEFQAEVRLKDDGSFQVRRCSKLI